jgi:Major capsid protein N-terminus/Large eukaryotic DNA virus major capsid protein
MSGGIVQLVATGAQDAWLTGKPEVSFFRSNYKRYTHYANTTERQIIQGQPTAGGISTIRFEKKGDLLSYTYFSARDANGSLVYNLDWSKVIDKVELLIGGQVIDTHDFEYMTDIEPITGAQTFSQRTMNLSGTSLTSQRGPYLPLKFFFCKDWSVSLPLVALQFHDVELRITWSSNLSSTVDFGTTTNPVLSAQPQGTLNVYSISSGLTIAPNVANVLVSSSTGLVYPGQLVVAPGQNTSTNVSVIQAISNITAGGIVTSNVGIAFANLANASVTTLYTAGANLNVYAPFATSQVSGSQTFASGTTSGTLQLIALSGATPQLGQYVAGLPFSPAYVSSVSNISNSNVTITYSSLAQSTVVPNGRTVSFLPGTAQSSVKYSDLQFQAWTNFIHLDQTEREYFAKTTQDLLITQVVRVAMLNNPVQEIALAHPIKFIAFPCASYSSVYAGGANSAGAVNYQLKTQINGVDVGESRYLPAFVDAAQYYHTPYGYVHSGSVANVAIISYCLDTSKLQPTGTLNFSRLDTYRLITPSGLTNGLLGLANPAISTPYLYAVNYNVLRIQNGLGGVLYAN